MNGILIGWGVDPKIANTFDEMIIAAFLVILAIGLDYLCQAIFVGSMKKLAQHTHYQWDSLLLKRKVVHHLVHTIPGILVYALLPLAFIRGKGLLLLSQKICAVYIVFALLLAINGFILVFLDMYNMRQVNKNRPIKGFMQVLQVLLFFIGGIVIIAILIGKSPASLFAGLGASAAILMLVFKDTILGFVAGIQLSANDMLRPGDWITMEKYGANGTVIEVTLNAVKVKNFDNTITTIPPYALVSDAFQNWRGMSESPGRRIKRSINIDMNSVSFCTPEMLAKFRKISLLTDYIDEKEKELNAYNEEHRIDGSIRVNGRRQTNIGVFRAYLVNYLKSLPEVSKELTCMVRQLQPTETGIPIELYFFSSVKDWVPYEGIQSDVFDHVLAVIPEFGLSVFQNVSGSDLRGLKIVR
jgi:miniconductance mechanosensitive channel